MPVSLHGFWSGFEQVLDYPINLLVRHFERRMTELCMATIMLGLGMLLFVSPGSLETDALRYLSQWADAAIWTVIFFSGGIARIIALALNGHWMPQGAYVRATGAVIGAFVWAQWGAAIYAYCSANQTAVSPGVVVYFVLSVFEMISAYRALAGAKAGNGRTD